MNKKFIKSFKKKQKQALKKSRFLLRHPLLVPVSSFMVLFFVGLVSFIFLGASTQGAADVRIVNIYYAGEQRTVTTRAKNVGQLIERLELPIVEEDIVEPAKSSLILEDDTQVNIYKARPVEVIDAGRTLTLFTAQRAPRLVAIEAGLVLEPEDRVSFERIESNVLDSAVSEQLIIVRSVGVQLNVYGVVKSLRTTLSTVNELLDEQGISPAEDDTLQPALDSEVFDGMLISLNRQGIKTSTITELIPFETESKDNPELKAGTVQIEREGKNGERAVIYEIIEQDGIEISRREIQHIITKNPVNAIQLRGTKIIAPSFNPSVTVSGDKASLMTAAGIAESDFAYVDFVISKESGWRPGAANSYSGAYGLCQALPASKMASAGADYLTNPVTQLKWCSGYATGRYGGWAGAYQIWQVQNWW